MNMKLRSCVLLPFCPGKDTTSAGQYLPRSVEARQRAYSQVESSEAKRSKYNQQLRWLNEESLGQSGERRTLRCGQHRRKREQSVEKDQPAQVVPFLRFASMSSDPAIIVLVPEPDMETDDMAFRVFALSVRRQNCTKFLSDQMAGSPCRTWRPAYNCRIAAT